MSSRSSLISHIEALVSEDSPVFRVHAQQNHGSSARKCFTIELSIQIIHCRAERDDFFLRKDSRDQEQAEHIASSQASLTLTEKWLILQGKPDLVRGKPGSRLQNTAAADIVETNTYHFNKKKAPSLIYTHVRSCICRGKSGGGDRIPGPASLS